MELFMGMVACNPKDRYTIEDIRENRWFKQEVYSEKKIFKLMRH